MFNLIGKAAITAWIGINIKNLVRIGGNFFIFLVVTFLYLRWEVYLIEVNPSKLFFLLIIYSLLIVLILGWIIILSKQCLNPLRPNNAIKAKESITEKPKKFDEILSIKLRPKLKGKE